MKDLVPLTCLYGACAVTYAALGGVALRRNGLRGTRGWFGAACAATMAWCASIALAWLLPVGRLSAWLDMVRLALWYAFILRVYHLAFGAQDQIRAVFRPLGATTLLLIAAATAWIRLHGPGGMLAQTAGIATHLGFPVCCLLLLENLYRNTPGDLRWNVNLLCLGLGATFSYDLVLYADAALFRHLSVVLVEARAPVMMLAAPLLAAAASRNRRWLAEVRLSHDLAFHGFTLVGSGIFLLSLALAGEMMRRDDARWGSVAETSLVVGGILAVAVVVTSGSARSRIRGAVTRHLFSQRYDYRREWLRCIETLTAPEAFVSLPRRAIRAAAAAVDSPAGALFVRPPQDVAFQWAGSWNMPAATAPVPPGHPIVPLFRDGEWIVNIDDHAGGVTWFPDLTRTWLVLPLPHFGTLIGFVVLARPRAHFRLDREAYDLLRVIGHEIASRVAEQRAVQVLSQTRQLREYGQRFAFVIHDMKNVSGQLSMLLSNAEVHADNPAFQKDMLATVRASAGRITRLLTRLEAERRERDHALVTPAQRLRALADLCRVTSGRDVTLADASAGAGAAIDPDGFDAVATHLLNNALEASPPDRPVQVSLRREAPGIVIDITDHGPGMRPEFVRDDLFRPLRTTKSDGHGIGAYQARELLRDAGGDLLVLSRPGAGTTMRVILPAVHPALSGSIGG